MNRIHQSIWNDSSGTFVAASESASSAGKKKSSRTTGRPGAVSFAINALSACLMLTFGASVHALPQGGVVAAGGATIASGASATTITQSTANAVINWQSFGIAAGQTVQFVQPGSSSVALNRVLGADPSSIMGNLSANGKVFLLNPNGVLFGSGASVNVGGLLASTLRITDSNFMAGNYAFTDAGSGTVVNQGSINAANGGYVALMGKSVSNQGVISAKLGSVALAAGNAITMDVSGDGLLNVSVAQGSVNALVDNGGLIRADGGRVLLTAQAAGDLLKTAVNNTGVIQAQTIENRNGTILLLGDMQSGTMSVGGTLDASAPNGGNGGFIETSAANVKIQDNVRVTTSAPRGLTGTWLIDPVDFTVGSAPGDNISGAALSASLIDSNITITTVAGPGAGNGDIFVTEPIAWNGALGVSAVPTTLTLNALRHIFIGRDKLGLIIPTAAITPTNGSLVLNAGLDVNIDAAISPTRGNLVVCCGQDINVNAAITTVNGSVLLSAGRDIRVVRSNINPNAAITTTDGNIEFCAGRDVILNNTFDPGLTPLMTLTRGSTTAGEDLREFGVPLGLTLRSGNAATEPGPAGGTVNFVNGGLAGTFVTVTAGGPGTPVSIFYNPINYATPTPYSLNFTGNGGPVTSFMLAYPDVVSKTADGSTTATLSGFKSTGTSGVVPGTVTLVAGPSAAANFDTPLPGTNKLVTYSGFTLAQGAILPGDAAINFALPTPCCGVVTRTTGNIVAGTTPQPQPQPPQPPPPPIAAVSGELPYIELAAPVLATFASYRPGLMPTYASDARDVFFVVKEQEVVAPTPIPFIPPPPPYVAPPYVPKPTRN